MKKCFYAVKNGITPGIYESWEECSAQVSGFKGAEYKGFATRAEAEAYLGVSAGTDKSDNLITVPIGTAVAYVDGSFMESAKKFAYGVVLFVNQNGSTREMHLSKAFSNPELLEMRNVSGEIMGAAEAMKQARELGLSEITIYHDYQGIASWCLGQWKTNKVWTQKYKAFYEDISKDITIRFVKVKGHSGDKYNELADQLAKGALTNEPIQ